MRLYFYYILWLGCAVRILLGWAIRDRVNPHHHFAGPLASSWAAVCRDWWELRLHIRLRWICKLIGPSKIRFQDSKKSPTGPSERTPKTWGSNSSSNFLRGPLVRSHLGFDRRMTCLKSSFLNHFGIIKWDPFFFGRGIKLDAKMYGCFEDFPISSALFGFSL